MTDGLLRWANRFTRGHDNVEPVQDWTDSWANGLAFCALMHNWFPEKIPIKELKTETEADCIYNCNLAFQVGKENGIENLLDGEDIVLIQDKKSIILYVSEIYGALHEVPVKYTCPPEWDRAYDRKIEDAKIAERKAQLEANKTGKAHFSFGRGASLKGGVANKFLNNMNQSEPGSPPAGKEGAGEDKIRTSESSSSLKDRWNPEAQKKKEEEEEKLREAKQAEIRRQMEAPKKEEVKKEEVKKEEPKVAPKSTLKKEETKKEEPPKKEEPKKEEPPKKPELKKEETKKEEPPKKEEPKKEEPKKPLVKATTTKQPEPQPKEDSYVPVDGTLTYTISGKGKDGGPVGKMLIITVNLSFNGGSLPAPPKKEDLSVHIEAPGEHVRCTVMCSNNTYHVGFTPTAPGQYWVDFEWKNLFCDKPFLLPISALDKSVPEHVYEGIERKRHASNSGKPAGATQIPRGSAASDSPMVPTKKSDESSKSSEAKASTKTTDKSVAPPSASNCTASGPGVTAISDTEAGEFLITARDSKDNVTTAKADFQVRINGPSKPKITVTAVGDGTYKANYGVVDAGHYTVDVLLGKSHIKGSPFMVDVTESVFGGEVAELTILLQTFSKGGEKMSQGGFTEAISIDSAGNEPQLNDLDDGRYTIDYEAHAGKNNINVKINGKTVSGFPLNFTV